MKPNRNDVLTALRQYGVLHSQADANRLLHEIGGVELLALLPEAKFATVIQATGMTDQAATIDPAAIYERLNRPRRPIGAAEDDGDRDAPAAKTPVIDDAFAERAFARFNNPPKRPFRDSDGRPLPSGGGHGES